MSTTHPPRTLLEVTVSRVEDLAANLRRVTFFSPELGAHKLSGLDEYFGLVMPRLGQPWRPFEVAGLANLRAAVAAIPRPERPELRWYTVRRHRRRDFVIDADIVTHGDEGPGSAWISRVRPGQAAGLWLCEALWRPGLPQTLVADATAAPALWHLCEQLDARHPEALAEMSAVVLHSRDGELEPGQVERWAPRLGCFERIRCPANTAPDNALAVLNSWRAEERLAPETLWVSGEGGLAKAVRGLAVQKWGLAKDAVVWVPYWFQGRARP